MSNLRDTIWASYKEKIFLTGICDHYKNYIKKIAPAYPQVTLEISETITNDVPFTAIQALNIFRILQEASTNALKHSGASLLNIIFESNHLIKLSVTDNGRGITDANYLTSGNGIKNMKQRAFESGMFLSVEKNGLCGTSIIITPAAATT